ncbi:MAG: ABC transporter permease, partial [Acidimicrobiales bacterium]
MQVPLSLRPVHYFWTAFRRQWRSDLSTTFLTPVLYLASIGVGLGAFIKNGHAVASLGGENYLSFVAPALLVTTAMQVAVERSTYEVYGCKNWWSGAYRSMQAT